MLRPANLRYGSLLRDLGPRCRDGRVEIVIDSLRFARDRGATVLEAPTLEELGYRLSERGVDGDRAVATIRSFNEHVRAGTAGDQDVPRTDPVHPSTGRRTTPSRWPSA